LNVLDVNGTGFFDQVSARMKARLWSDFIHTLYQLSVEAQGNLSLIFMLDAHGFIS
jgi:hypothetical protein